MSKREEFIDRATKKICDQLGDDYRDDFSREAVRNSVIWSIDLAAEINIAISDFQSRFDCGDLAPLLAIAVKHAIHTNRFNYEMYKVGDSIANLEGAWHEISTLLSARDDDYADVCFSDEYGENEI